MNRRLFLHAAGLAGGATFLSGAVSRALAGQTAPAAKQPVPVPRLDLAIVEEFVRVAHTNLDRTRELLTGQGALVNATWDWGGGDWETGLGAASHMGRPDIAEYLLANGARMDVFCAAMMGKIEIVRAFLNDDPSVINLKGPHGIPLLRHAIAGKQDAVAELLKSKGATE